MSISSESTVRLPPRTRVPGPLLLAGWVASRRSLLQHLQRKHGSTFAMSMPPFGPSVVLTSADLTKQLFTTDAEVSLPGEPGLGNILGPGSTFSLLGTPHRRRRKLLVPPFHGRQMRAHEQLMVEETRRAAATWPKGVEFAMNEPLMELALTIILKTVLGATGKHYDDLQRMMPALVELGTSVTTSPFANPNRKNGAWARYRAARAAYDVVALDLIRTARRDPHLDDRNDMLAMMIQSRYEDGEPMGDQEIADELLTLLGAGHETTANTLSWTIERLRRHPMVLDKLVEEVDAGGSDYLKATIVESQRVRPVIVDVTRKVAAETMPLGEWVLPRGYQVLVATDLVQMDENVFPDPERFDPDRFVDAKPGMYSWVPFGGGTRRCIGAAFAEMEMTAILRTLLEEYELMPSVAPDEKWKSRGVAWTPHAGALAVWHERETAAVLPVPAGAAVDA